LKSAALILSALIVALAAARASAQVDPFEFEVYPYQVEGRGVFELESLNSFVPSGHSEGDNGTSSGTFPSQAMYRSSIEATYGLTEKTEFAAYLDLAHPNGASFQYAGSRYRLRGSLFEQGELPVDLGWYLELEWHRTPEFDDNQLEVELRAIVEKDWHRFMLDLNPLVEKPIFLGPNHNKGFEFGYTAGLYYRWRRYVSPGLEFYGGTGLIDDSDPLYAQQHYAFAVLWGRYLPGGFSYNCGAGIGLTRGSDRVITKCNIEWEHYAGSML
jgi:hypothetical protein